MNDFQKVQDYQKARDAFFRGEVALYRDNAQVTLDDIFKELMSCSLLATKAFEEFKIDNFEEYITHFAGRYLIEILFGQPTRKILTSMENDYKKYFADAIYALGGFEKAELLDNLNLTMEPTDA